MKAWGGLAILVCALTALAVPTGSAAKPGYQVLPHEHSVEAQVRGSNGYRLRIVVLADVVAVFANRGNEQVVYIPMNSRFRDGRMRAHLPGVGRIDLRFHERTRSREDPASNCKGAGALTRRGIFRGMLKLAGEREFTRVDVRAVHGQVVDEPRQVCRRNQKSRASTGTQEELLRAVAPRGKGSLEFFGLDWGTRLGLPNTFSASLTRLRGQMIVTNRLYGFDEDPAAITVSAPPISGSVVPPKPLIGAATFQREPDGAFTWTGNLAAELPGIGPIKLAGAKFNAEACLGRICKGSTDSPQAAATRLGYRPTAAAPTPSPWRWPGFPR